MIKEILKDKRILIVDDEPDVLESLLEILDACFVDAAPNFETAKKFLNRNDYDAAILDIMGVDGYKLLEIANARGIPALMLTAHALSPDHLVKSLKEGACSYIPKDKMADVEVYLSDLLGTCEKGRQGSGNWLKRIQPFFDQKFGAGWKEKDKDFWRDYEESHPATREELGKML
jgi:DNA-binding NtrC family response regulator